MRWLLDDLNQPQQEAVTTTDGPLLIIAGAGSGKTRVLTRRIAWILVNRLATPRELLAVTFTNKAAGEMKQRVNELMGGVPGEMNVSTFHSFCSRFLRAEASHLGYPKQFTIFDSADSVTLIKSCIKELGISEQQFPAKGQRAKISDAKNQLKLVDDFASAATGYFESRTADIYRLYQQKLLLYGAMDFDDLLVNTVRILAGMPELATRYQQRFKYLMVDEYQDTNHVQYLLLKRLLGSNDNIGVVGDEDQSIYGWRGADIRNILEFEKDFPRARVIKLEQNYRSTGSILKAASAVISNNSMRKAKVLWTSAGDGEKLSYYHLDSAEREAEEVTSQISGRPADLALAQIAILYRTNAQSRPFEERLRRAGIPYQIIGGTGFYERKEVKDLLAYLRLIVNGKDDVAFERIVNYPKRGLGDKTVSDILELAKASRCSAFELLESGGHLPQLSAKQNRLQPFVQLVTGFRAKVAGMPVDLLIQELVETLRLIEELKTEDPVVAETRVENIEAFLEGAAEYARANSSASLAEYLADISLFTDLDTYREIDDKVTMMTIHSAKGLEYDSVFLVGLEEGLFPMQRAMHSPVELEEERRLFYVGATRARHRLVLTAAHLRNRFGDVESIPSRFIREIPSELLERYDRRTARRFEYTAPAFAPGRSSVPAGVHYVYDEQEPMQVGRIVTHPTFGRGRILSADGYGDSLRLEIMFTGVGVKKIMARFAKLKVVG